MFDVRLRNYTGGNTSQEESSSYRRRIVVVGVCSPGGFVCIVMVEVKLQPVCVAAWPFVDLFRLTRSQNHKYAELNGRTFVSHT